MTIPLTRKFNRSDPIQRADMSRNILTILGILFCSTSAFGQQFQVPQNTTSQTNRASFQPPSSTGFQPVQTADPQPLAEPKKQKEPLRPVQLQQPQTEQAQIIVPPKKEVQPTFQPRLQPTVQPKAQAQIELPAPRAEILELKEDNQVYRSATHNNSLGVSDYRFEVAKERARARRMRLEVKKWYGVDSARPVVAPRGNLPTYSAYYNGVFSRHSLQYNYGNSFYFHVPVAR